MNKMGKLTLKEFMRLKFKIVRNFCDSVVKPVSKLNVLKIENNYIKFKLYK